MARKTTVLFYLDADQSRRLSIDAMQWILEAGRATRRRPGSDSGFRGFAFVRTEKEILRRCIRENSVRLTEESAALLDALPGNFFECRRLLDAYGSDTFRDWLAAQAKAKIGLPEAIPDRCREASAPARDPGEVSVVPPTAVAIAQDVLAVGSAPR